MIPKVAVWLKNQTYDLRLLGSVPCSFQVSTVLIAGL
jgi:hypothetical protein